MPERVGKSLSHAGNNLVQTDSKTGQLEFRPKRFRKYLGTKFWRKIFGGIDSGLVVRSVCPSQFGMKLLNIHGRTIFSLYLYLYIHIPYLGYIFI